MSHRLERLAIWLSAVVGGIVFLYAGVTGDATTPPILLGVYLVLGIALLAVGVLGFASEVVGAVRRRLPDESPRGRAKQSGIPAATPPEPLPPDVLPALPRNIVDRVYTKATPAQIVGLYRQHTTMEADRRFAAFAGEFIEVRGKVMDTSTSGQPTVYLKPVGVGSDGPSMYAVRLDKAWVGRLATLRKDDEIRAVGRLQNATSGWIGLAQSELLD
jgi:hypothetical protein